MRTIWDAIIIAIERFHKVEFGDDEYLGFLRLSFGSAFRVGFRISFLLDLGSQLGFLLH